MFLATGCDFAVPRPGTSPLHRTNARTVYIRMYLGYTVLHTLVRTEGDGGSQPRVPTYTRRSCEHSHELERQRFQEHWCVGRQLPV